MIKNIARAGLFLWLGVGGSQGADPAEPPPVLRDSSVKIIEERKVIETRKVYDQERVAARPRKTAIFVENRAGAQLNDKILFFEDQIASRASGKDFIIISREDVLKSVKVYRGADVDVRSNTREVKGTGSATEQANVNVRDDQRTAVVGAAKTFPDHAGASVRVDSQVTTDRNRSAAGSASTDVNASVTRTDVQSNLNLDAERNSLGTKLDQLLNDNSSALRLAQNMGADFILFASIGSFGKETKSFSDASIGVSTKNIVYNLRGTCKIVEGVTGGSLGGEPFRATKTIRQTENLQTEQDDLVNELLEDAAAKVAEGLVRKAGQFVPSIQPGKVEISIACGVRDLQGNEITLPDLRVNENNQIVQGDTPLQVQASATVEIDGFAMGTTPARIQVAPGPHKLRLTRPSFEPVELTINAAQGLALSPTMQLSREGFQRWMDVRKFLNALDRDRNLTDARAEEIRGNAQRLRQSGFLVNTTQAPTINYKKSIYSMDN